MEIKILKEDISDDDIFDTLYNNTVDREGRRSFEIEDGVLKRYSGKDAIVNIPYGVIEIGCCALKNCRTVKEITIPDGVTEIGYSAFENCTSLKEITIPDSVTEIGVCAFYNCTSLKEINASDKIREIITFDRYARENHIPVFNQ